MKLVSVFLFTILMSCQPLTPQAGIVDQQGHPSATLLQIFRTFSPLLKSSKALSGAEIEHILDPRTPSTAISLQSLNQLAQDKFRRPAGLERRQLPGTLFSQQFLPYDTPELRALFEKLGDIKAVHHTAGQPYRYILFNGSTLVSMRQRLKTLIDRCVTGELTITPAVHLVFLTGDRGLFPDETAALLLDPAPLPKNPHWIPPTVPAAFPKNEYQAAQWIWAQTDLPAALRQMQITFVNAAKHPLAAAVSSKLAWRRPNTLETVQAWLQQKPAPGHCISLSNQPYVAYQTAVIQSALKQAGTAGQGWTVEGIGDRAADNLLLALLMDNIAGTIFATLQ